MTDQIAMKCEDAIRLLAQFLDGELNAADASAVHHHLEQCRSCYSRAEFERRLKEQLAELAHSSTDAALELRIRNLMGNFRTNDSGE
jgi:anti-sigma factor (TIGR02949 family)